MGLETPAAGSGAVTPVLIGADVVHEVHASDDYAVTVPDAVYLLHGPRCVERTDSTDHGTVPTNLVDADTDSAFIRLYRNRVARFYRSSICQLWTASAAAWLSVRPSLQMGYFVRSAREPADFVVPGTVRGDACGYDLHVALHARSGAQSRGGKLYLEWGDSKENTLGHRRTISSQPTSPGAGRVSKNSLNARGGADRLVSLIAHF